MDNLKESKGVIWISGYSSSGKTTVGRKVEYKLRNSGLRTVFLDGDDLRSIFANRWGFGRDDRIELAKIYFRFCSHLAAQGFTIVISAVAMYDEVRQWLHDNVPASVEVYLDVPESVRRRRDALTKGVYAKNPFGKDLYDEARSPDLVVRNLISVAAPKRSAQMSAQDQRRHPQHKECHLKYKLHSLFLEYCIQSRKWRKDKDGGNPWCN